MAADNRLLGRFNLDGIDPAPRGTPQIEVKFDIDANGILNVSAKDKKTSKEAKIRIESSSGLSKDEVEKMKRDAESHASEDKSKRELADLRNEADATVWQVEKLIKDQGEKLSESDKAPVQSAIDKVRESLKGDNADAVRQALNNLQSAAHALAQHVGRAGGGAEAGGRPEGPPPGGDRPKDDVIDAEFEVKK
jgi:molecular chaperone DnaK